MSSNSSKPEVISILFEQIWPRGATAPIKTPMIVTSDEVVEAIKERNRRVAGAGGKKLSDKNPANFLKDFIRKPSCNDNWPPELLARRITARQRYGRGQIMEFVEYRDGDTLPFPDRYGPTPDMRVIEIESLSIPRQARALGRPDEPWLIQIVVSQHIAHTHFAVVSRHLALDLTHLQMSVKTQPEIDAIYVATIEKDGREARTLITCEAKQYGERLLEDQIREQVQQAFALTPHLSGTDAIEAIVPLAVQVISYSVGGESVRGIYVVEFGMITRRDFEANYQQDNLHDMPLPLESRAFYRLKPDVPGISKRLPRR